MALREDIPVLLVRGLKSDVVSDAGVAAFLELLPRLEVADVNGAGHMVAGDRNDIFAQSVIEFLKRTVPVGASPTHPAHTLQPHHEGPPGDVRDIP